MRLFFILASLSLASAASVLDRSLGLQDIQDMFDHLGDEILTHGSLSSPSSSSGATVHDLGVVSDRDGEQEGQEQEDDEVPHPVLVHNWGSGLDVGQVASVAVDADDNPVLFHRGCHVWDDKTFDGQNQLLDRTPVPNATVVTVDADSGEALEAWGEGMFYMPHGIAIDAAGNTYLVDAGAHQVYRFPPGSDRPDLVLGEKFVPGRDSLHFCQPTAVAVSDDAGVFFVADGYCNSRVMKFSREGKLLKIIHGNWKVVHSVALFEQEDVLCVSDREGRRVECVRAGVNANPGAANPATVDNAAVNGEDVTGAPVVTYKGVGRSFAIAAKGTALLSVSGQPEVGGITIDTAAHAPQILDRWGNKGEMVEPHGLAISQFGDSVFVADIAAAEGGRRGALRKFEVVRKDDFP